jgi:2-amino-4-ketopentanoate thiolase alpha subunit
VQLKGSYVEIVQVVLSPSERASNIPLDTKQTPLKQWSKGWLLEDSDIGCTAVIKTVNGRLLEGIVTDGNPAYDHSFGAFVPEIMFIGHQAKRLLWGD